MEMHTPKTLPAVSYCHAPSPILDWNKYQSADCYARWAYEIPKALKNQLLKVGDTIKMLNKQGEWEDYYFLPMHSIHKGIAGVIYISKTQIENRAECNLENNPDMDIMPELIVAFRGTVFSDADSVQRNLEKKGPGYESFMQSKDNFMEDIQAALDIFFSESPKVNIQVIGHSLGGADAQYLTMSLMEEITQREHFDKIANIDLMVHNSVGVCEDVVHKTTHLLSTLNEKTDVKITAHYGLVAGDGLQQFGNSMIFHESDPNLVYVDLLKIGSKYEGIWNSTKNLFGLYAGFMGTLKTHTQYHFGGKLTPEDKWEPSQNYIFVDNQNPIHAKYIQQELLTKSTYIAKEWVQSVKNTLHSLLDWLSPWMESSSQSPTKVDHQVWSELVQDINHPYNPLPEVNPFPGANPLPEVNPNTQHFG